MPYRYLILKNQYLLSLLFILTASFSFSQNSLHFEDNNKNFGKVNEGAPISFYYHFTNVSQKPVIINDYKVTCSCTKARLPEKPILPNHSDSIRVDFDTNEKIGFQKRTVILKTSAGDYTLLFKGRVKATEETKELYRQLKKNAKSE